MTSFPLPSQSGLQLIVCSEVQCDSVTSYEHKISKKIKFPLEQDWKCFCSSDFKRWVSFGESCNLTTRLPIIIALCIISHLQKFLLLIIGSFSFSLYFTFMVNTMLSRSLSIILISYSFLLSFFILKVLWMEWYIFLNFGPTDFYFVLCFWRNIYFL